MSQLCFECLLCVPGMDIMVGDGAPLGSETLTEDWDDRDAQILAGRNHTAQQAKIKELSRHESRSSAGKNQGAEQTAMKWLSRL